jgi:hypothetical protein
MRRMQRQTAEPPTWRGLFASSNPALFQGRVSANSFTLKRGISYRSDMRPQITGWVEPTPASRGSLVRPRHRLDPVTLAFAAFWLTGVCFGISIVSTAWLDTGHSVPPFLIPFGMLAFGLLFFSISFWLEVNESRPLLVELLQLTPATLPS